MTALLEGEKTILSEPIDWIGTVKVFHLGAFGIAPAVPKTASAIARPVE